MASYGNTVLTSAGIDLVKRVIAKTATFEITRVATSSDSRLTNATISAIEAMTALPSVNQTGTVTAFDMSNNKQIGLKCEFTNQGLTNQYSICGVGIYAKEAGKNEILFAVSPAKEPETMPAKPDDQSALFSFSLNMYVVVGQASAMSITATTEGVVKSINGTIKPDANGNIVMSYYSQAEVDSLIANKAILAEAGAGAHNSIYRGKYLGSTLTDAQVAAIKAGTFENLYIGDYWVIGGVTYRIAAFDYYLGTGDTKCTTHHVVVVPDAPLYVAKMNETDTTAGAYAGSEMYTTGLSQAKTIITAAFGSGHILTHRNELQNACTKGVPTGVAWFDSKVELMTEQNVYGAQIMGALPSGGTVNPWDANGNYNYLVDRSQFSLFAFRPDLISNRSWFWLRTVVSATTFALVAGDGVAVCSGASYSGGVRPAFSIC